MKKFLILLFGIFISSVCFAEIFTEDAPQVLKYGEWLLGFLGLAIKSQAALYLTWFSTIMFGVMVLARAIAEVLSLFAEKTKTDVDNKAMAFFSKTADACARVVAWFGVGYPKSLK
jgi:hypothetical protein